MTIRIEVDGEAHELTDDQIVEEFTWANMQDSNHCRRIRKKIFEAVLALARTDAGNDGTSMRGRP